jgi:hypothetical protein
MNVFIPLAKPASFGNSLTRDEPEGFKRDDSILLVSHSGQYSTKFFPSAPGPRPPAILRKKDFVLS